MENNEFYFIYVVIGTPWIKVVTHNFSSIPDGTNVVILTNTPHLLEQTHPRFNLTVVDIETLRDDWSKENEKILYSETDDEYNEMFFDSLSKKMTYPMQIMRYGIKWATLNNITKFILLEGGMTIGDTDPEQGFKIFKEKGETKNLMFANTYYNPHDQVQDYLKIPQYRKILTDNNIDLDNYSETFCTELDPNYKGSITFEGGMMGFWFHSVSLVELAFTLYTEIVKEAFKNNYIRSISGFADNFEWISAILATTFAKYHNTLILNYGNFVSHFYHPEEYFYIPQGKRVTGDGNIWLHTNTREEFLEKNREGLLSIFGNLERAIKTCHGFK